MEYAAADCQRIGRTSCCPWVGLKLGTLFNFLLQKLLSSGFTIPESLYFSCLLRYFFRHSPLLTFVASHFIFLRLLFHFATIFIQSTLLLSLAVYQRFYLNYCTVRHFALLSTTFILLSAPFTFKLLSTSFKLCPTILLLPLS